MILADDDAFAGGEARRFDDDWHGKAAELFVDLFEGDAEGVRGGGDIVALHELFGEGFAGLEHCCSLCRAEDSIASFVELVDEADREWELGADDGEGRLLDDDDVDHLVEVAGIDGDAASEFCDASVAGSAENLRDLRRFAERPDEGVLATSTPDDQNLHPSFAPVARMILLCSFEASIVADEVKRPGLFHRD
jgi:hypothetical protein